MSKSYELLLCAYENKLLDLLKDKIDTRIYYEIKDLTKFELEDVIKSAIEFGKDQGEEISSFNAEKVYEQGYSDGYRASEDENCSTE